MYTLGMNDRCFLFFRSAEDRTGVPGTGRTVGIFCLSVCRAALLCERMTDYKQSTMFYDIVTPAPARATPTGNVDIRN